MTENGTQQAQGTPEETQDREAGAPESDTGSVEQEAAPENGFEYPENHDITRYRQAANHHYTQALASQIEARRHYKAAMDGLLKVAQVDQETLKHLKEMGACIENVFANFKGMGSTLMQLYSEVNAPDWEKVNRPPQKKINS